MDGIKKLNLLPIEVKNRYFKKYIRIFCGILGAVFLAVLLVQYINIGILSLQIKSIKNENNKYNEAKDEIAKIQESIKKYDDFVKTYDTGCFPFSEFMYDLEIYRPETVTIISIDTPDRLVNEGVHDENEEKASEKNDNKKSDDKKKEEAKDSKEKKDDKDKKEESDKAEDETENKEEDDGKIKYVSDLTGQELVIRGYGSNQNDISQFIYNLSKLSYIASAKITAIEEHTIEDGVYNIFEITVLGGAGY